MSAAPAKSQDPSMEEILASIRRIIADDTETAKQEDAAGADASAIAAAVMAAAGTGSSDPDDDVLDLADLSAPPPAREFEAPREEIGAQPRDFAFEDAPAAPQPAFVAPISAPVPPPAPQPSRPAPIDRPAAPARAEAPPSAAESILSSHATASVGQAFNLLSNTILSQSAMTLEDVVRDMLKPMLKMWLDDNLPPMVERLVRAEIERVARGNR